MIFRHPYQLILIIILLINGSTGIAVCQPLEADIDTVTLIDNVRQRRIPIALYKPGKEKANQQIIIFSHGYGQNQGGDYMKYSYLTKYLSEKGYFVVSIQHELPTDDLIPSNGVPQVVRSPFWNRGVDNIMYVINELKKSNADLNFKSLVLIGHSNGADMVALFPQKYPNIAYKIIMLDNRRMMLPRTKKNPKVYSLRSSDQPADEGVLPTDKEQKKLGITVVKLPNTIHNDMDDRANASQRKEINEYLLSFLKN